MLIFRTTAFSGFDNRAVFQKELQNTTFWKLDLFAFSGEGIDNYLLYPNHWTSDSGELLLRGPTQ
jgi:hypothetical protein